MKEKQLKNLIKAIVLYTEYDGIEPSYSAYGDECASMDYELKTKVNNIFEKFQSLEEYDEEEAETEIC